MMKKLLIFLMAFTFIGAQGQIQNTISQKGLIAHIGMSENHQQPGVNLVTNGTFATDASWGTHTGWTISAGVATYGDADADAYLDQALVLTSGKQYIITFQVTSAVAYLKLTNQAAAAVSATGLGLGYASYAVGNYTQIFLATASATGIRIYSTTTAAAAFSIDNFVIREYNATTTDLITGIAGTNTDVVVVQGKGGEGSDRYNEYNGSTSKTTLADNDLYDFGTGNFSVLCEFTPANITQSGKYIFNKEAGGIGYGLYQTTNDLYLRFDDNTTDVSAIIGTDVLLAGTKYVAVLTFTRSGNAVLYLNGVSSGTVAISTASLTISNTGAFVISDATAGSANWAGNIYRLPLWNRALSIGEVQAYSRATTTTPNLVSGLRYRILTVGTANWTSIGAASAAVGVEFTCNTTAQTGTGTATPLSNYLTFADRGATNTEVITNGDFASDTWWSKGANTTISGGAAHFITETSYGIWKVTILTSGYKYRVKFTVSNYSAGGVRIHFVSSATGTTRSANGTYTEEIVADNTTFALQAVGSTTLDIDDVSVIRIGNTLNLDASGIRPTTWVDLSRSTPITGTNTAVTPVIPPSSELGAMDFNGTTSKIALTGMNGLTGDISYSQWFNFRSFSSGYLTLFDNSKFRVAVDYNSANLRMVVYSDDATGYVTANNSVYPLTWWHIVVTRTSGGVGNVYINGVLSGTANQATGTPVAGTSHWVGSDNGAASYFRGQLTDPKFWGYVMTATEALAEYNRTK